MSSAASPPTPGPGERGLASRDLPALAAQVLGAWDDFLDVAAGTALDSPSRLPGWTGRDVLVHLGSWPERPALDQVLAGARSGERAPQADDADARNAALVDAHRDAGRDEVLAALRANRDSVAAFLASAEASGIGLRPTASALGPLPVLTVVGAVAYELAVHALDVAPCPAPPPAPRLLHAGLGALVDVTGALAARAGLQVRAFAVTPTGGWSFSTGDGAWTVREHPPGERPAGAGVEAAADVLLDASAGRRAVPPLLLRGEIHAHDVSGLLALAPLVESVPGLPGGASLGAAARYLGGASRLARHLPRLRGR